MEFMGCSPTLKARMHLQVQVLQRQTQPSTPPVSRQLEVRCRHSIAVLGYPPNIPLTASSPVSFIPMNQTPSQHTQACSYSPAVIPFKALSKVAICVKDFNLPVRISQQQAEGGLCVVSVAKRDRFVRDTVVTLRAPTGSSSSNLISRNCKSQRSIVPPGSPTRQSLPWTSQLEITSALAATRCPISLSHTTMNLPATCTRDSLPAICANSSLATAADEVKPWRERTRWVVREGWGRCWRGWQSRAAMSLTVLSEQATFPTISSAQTDTTSHPIYNIIMLEEQSNQPKELARQLALLIQQEDYESVKYLLSYNTPLEPLLPLLSPDIVLTLRKLQDEVKQEEMMDEEPNVDRNALIDAALEPMAEEDSDILLDKEDTPPVQLNQEQPIFNIIHRIHLTHGDVEARQATIEATKIQLQLLLGNIFSSQAITSLRRMHPHHKLDSPMKRYIAFLFPSLSHSFNSFTRVYRSIRSQTVRKFPQIGENFNEDDQTMKQVDVRTDQTLRLEEKQFLVLCAESVPSGEWRRYNQNRNYTFLHYGIKPFVEWIRLPPDVIAQFAHLRDFCDLLSFICMRLVRSFLFNANRRRHSGALQLLVAPFLPEQIMLVGNQLLPICEEKVRKFFLPVEPAEVQAHFLFVKEYHSLNYKDFIPSKYFAEAERNEIPPAEYVWQHLKDYRALWTQRVKVERYLQDGGERPQNEYVEYAEKKRKEWEMGRGKVWKEFIMERFGFKTTTKAPQKRAKLESLKD